METITDDLWLCADCHYQGDDMEEELREEIAAAVAKLEDGGTLVYADTDPAPEDAARRLLSAAASYVGEQSDVNRGALSDALDDHGHAVRKGNTWSDDSFSWSSCDCCDRGLGGARYHYILLK